MTLNRPHKAADRQHRAHGAAHGLRQRLRERHGRDLRPILRQKAAAARGEEHADDHGGQHVHAVKQQPVARAVKHAHACRADEKRWAGIVAECERALGLLARERAAAPQPGHGIRAERISARHAQQQRRCARAADAEELLPPAHPLRCKPFYAPAGKFRPGQAYKCTRTDFGRDAGGRKYSHECIVVDGGRVRVCIRGTNLQLVAMDSTALLISGTIACAEFA